MFAAPISAAAASWCASGGAGPRVPWVGQLRGGGQRVCSWGGSNSWCTSRGLGARFYGWPPFIPPGGQLPVAPQRQTPQPGRDQHARQQGLTTVPPPGAAPHRPSRPQSAQRIRAVVAEGLGHLVAQHIAQHAAKHASGHAHHRQSARACPQRWQCPRPRRRTAPGRWRRAAAWRAGGLKVPRWRMNSMAATLSSRMPQTNRWPQSEKGPLVQQQVAQRAAAEGRHKRHHAHPTASNRLRRRHHHA